MADQSASSREHLQGVVQDLPIAHKVAIGASVAVVALAAILFFRWISTPSYSVLTADISDSDLSEITLELDALGIEYRVEAAGDRVMVPRGELSAAKAGLASAGVSLATDNGDRPGFELLDDQGLAISTNLERINFQRAQEGELARTLRAMDRVNGATVHLVLPNDRLFGDPDNAAASVFIDVPSNFSLAETDAVANLVAGAVENLDADGVTIIDTQGRTLQAPASSQDANAFGGRNVLRTIEFENRLEADITRLLLSSGSGDRASVMVRAELSYDQVNEQSEVFIQSDVPITLREQTTDESFSGPGSAAPGGVAGVDGDDVPNTDTDSDIEYNLAESTTEFGVDSTIVSTVRAPGKLQALHVGIVVDDGSLTGNTVIDPQQLSDLISASIGLDQDRGDTLVVTAVAFEPVAELTAAEVESLIPATEAPATNPLDLAPQVVGALVLLMVAGALFMMMRKGSPAPVATPAALPSGLSPSSSGVGGNTGEPIELAPPVRAEVLDLVKRQPEDIATLLRGWLTTQ